MKLFSVLFSFVLFCMMLPAPICGAEVESKINEISFHDKIGESESVRFLLSVKVIPDIFIIGGKNPRLVLDFFNTGIAGTVANTTKTSGLFVKQIRMGRHNKPQPKTRIALDLAPFGIYEYSHTYIEAEKTLQVTIIQTGMFNLELGQTPKKVIQEQIPTQDAVVQKTPQLHADRDPEKVIRAKEQKVKKEIDLLKQTKSETEIAKEASSDTANDSIEKEPVTEILPEIIAGDAQLLAVAFENTSSKGEMVLFKLNGFYPPIVFGIEKGDPRVVCDFQDTQLSEKVTPNISANGRYVKTIKISKHTEPNKVRAVLNLTANKNYDLQQVFFKEDNLFVLIINTFEQDSGDKLQ